MDTNYDYFKPHFTEQSKGGYNALPKPATKPDPKSEPSK